MSVIEYPSKTPAPDASVFNAEPEFANLTEKQEQSLAALPAALEALGITGEELSREERCSFLKVAFRFTLSPIPVLPLVIICFILYYHFISK